MRYILFLFSFLVSLPTIATESEKPKYAISDLEAQIFVRYMNAIEQCIFPDLIDNPNPQPIYDKWQPIDHLTMYYFQQQLLAEIIGQENADLIHSDKPSKAYFEQQQEKFNHQKAYLDQEKCDKFKDRYQFVKEQIVRNLTNK